MLCFMNTLGIICSHTTFHQHSLTANMVSSFFLRSPLLSAPSIHYHLTSQLLSVSPISCHSTSFPFTPSHPFHHLLPIYHSIHRMNFGRAVLDNGAASFKSCGGYTVQVFSTPKVPSLLLCGIPQYSQTVLLYGENRVKFE